jgi:hypothetical protein
MNSRKRARRQGDPERLCAGRGPNVLLSLPSSLRDARNVTTLLHKGTEIA